MPDLSDPALTVALAEKVMGWKSGEPRHIVFEREGVWLRGVREWRPLDSMDDAWMIIQKLQADGWHYDVGDHNYKLNSYWARFGRGEYDDADNAWSTQHWSIAPTPQRAIALAALRAHGMEVADGA